MSIARDISRQTSTQTATLTANQTSVTVSGGFAGTAIDVYLNGARIVQGQDYSLNGTSGITLTQGASAGDIIEFVIRNTSNSGFSAADTGQIVDGAVTFDKLSDSATESSNVQKRVAKAWGNYNCSTTPITTRGSFNATSLTDNGVGNYVFNFSTNLDNNGYAISITTDGPVNTHHTHGYAGSHTTSGFTISVFRDENSANRADPGWLSVIVFGELA